VQYCVKGCEYGSPEVQSTGRVTVLPVSQRHCVRYGVAFDFE